MARRSNHLWTAAAAVPLTGRDSFAVPVGALNHDSDNNNNMRRRGIDDDDDDDNDGNTTMTPCILILNGWSPGPLNYIKRALLRHYNNGVKILEPLLEMPPFTLTWCLNPRYLGMVAFLGIYLFLVHKILHSIHLRHGSVATRLFVVFVLAILFFIGLRLVVSEVVRYSIQCNVDRCQQILSSSNYNNTYVVMVIGFSWGGAVAAELVAQHGLRLLRDIPCLLVAPTTAIVAQLCLFPRYMHQDAALRLVQQCQPQEQSHLRTTPNQDGEDDDGPRQEQLPNFNIIHVVHAYEDTAFCPHPQRWQTQLDPTSSLGTGNGSRGIQLTMLHDNHVFQHPNSRTEILNLVANMLNQSDCHSHSRITEESNPAISTTRTYAAPK